MSLEQVIHTLEARVYHLGKRLWRDDPVLQLHEEAEQMRLELRFRYDELSRCRGAVTAARRRVAAKELKVVLLASAIETATLARNASGAWQQALELEQLRQAIAADRAELPYLQRACRKHTQDIAQLEQRLSQLEKQLAPV
jgi:septal ring factor EnvC (AmiA/AmiB activator)